MIYYYEQLFDLVQKLLGSVLISTPHFLPKIGKLCYKITGVKMEVVFIHFVFLFLIDWHFTNNERGFISALKWYSTAEDKKREWRRYQLIITVFFQDFSCVVHSFCLWFQVRSLVAVLDPVTSQLLQPVFQFPENATLTKITFHAHTHVIYVYGSQVGWYRLTS